MKQFQYTVTDPVGIHARPAGLLSKAAKGLDSTITVAKADGSKSAVATKLMALMGLGIKTGETVTVTVEGGNEDANAAAMEQFFKENCEVSGMVKGVIFDMDGVLVDTEKFYHTQRLEFLRRMDYTPGDSTHLVGSNEPVIWKALVPESELLREELLSGYRAFRTLHPTPYAELLNPGALELLAELRRRKIKTGVASSSVWESVDRMLETTGAGDFIDHAASGEDCTAYKPDPEVYLKVLAALKLEASEAIAVEDSPTGIAAALNAGMQVYALRPREGVLDQSNASAILERLGDLLRYL